MEGRHPSDETASTPPAPASVAVQFEQVDTMVREAERELRTLQALTLTHILSDEQELDMLRLELRVKNLAPKHAELKRERAYEQAVVDTAAIKAHHDARIPTKEACYVRVGQALAEWQAACAALRQLHDEQVAPLARLTRAGSGDPVIAVRSGPELVKPLMDGTPLTPTQVKAVREGDPGLTPLSERVLQGYLDGLRGSPQRRIPA